MRLVAEAGLDADEARAVLASDRYAAEVRGDEQQARAYGITGVPFFVVDGRYGVSGAQPAEALGQVLEQAWAERSPLQLVDRRQRGPGLRRRQLRRLSPPRSAEAAADPALLRALAALSADDRLVGGRLGRPRLPDGRVPVGSGGRAAPRAGHQHGDDGDHGQHEQELQHGVSSVGCLSVAQGRLPRCP